MEGFIKHLAVSTLHAQWVAIRAFRLRWGNLAGAEDLVARLLWSFCLSRPLVKRLFPLWDLPLVLKALVSPPFEPLMVTNLISTTFKVVCLVAILLPVALEGWEL